MLRLQISKVNFTPASWLTSPFKSSAQARFLLKPAFDWGRITWPGWDKLGLSLPVGVEFDVGPHFKASAARAPALRGR